MRSITAVALSLTLLSTPALAQDAALARGSLSLDGQVAVTTSTSDVETDRRTTVTLAPSVQYFVADGLAVGGSLLLSYASAGESSGSNVGIGPSATYYFGSPAARVHPHVAASAFVGRSSIETPLYTYDASDTSVRGAAGVLLLLSPSVGVNAQLFYFYRASTFESVLGPSGPETRESAASSAGLSVGMTAFLF